MPTSTVPTRDRLLNAAQEIINRQGFSATSIDQIIEKAGVTKGTFFYHFKTKNTLARALIDRFAAGDREVLMANMERAEKLSTDPLQQLLIFIGLLLELAEQLDTEPNPGCLFATYAYESGLFDEETNGVITDAILIWRDVLGAKLRKVAEKYPPKADVDLDDVADLLFVVFEGAYVMSRAISGRGAFVDQIRLYRTYVQLLFNA
jgi:TetR/AcrR family transcriptional repressor of nem operon